MDNSLKNTININAVNHDLLSIEQLVWKKLVNGSIKKKNGFRTMCVGTIGKDCDTSLRIVVNRKVDELQKTIFFHTDKRSRKINDLQNDNRISLLFYDARQKIQIVVKARTTSHVNDTLTNERWKATSPQARLGYMTISAPNSRSNTPTLGYEERFSVIKPTETESDMYKDNFVVIACEAYEVEFLYLDYLGNRKANFYYKNGILEDCFWAVP